MPLLLVSKPIVCVVLARAVTVNTLNIPVLAACFKMIWSLLPAFRIRPVFKPVMPIYKLPVLLGPILPCDAISSIPAPAVKVWISAVVDVNVVPVISTIDPAVDVMLMALPVTAAVYTEEPVISALDTKSTLRPATNVISPDDDITVPLPPKIMSPADVCDVRLILAALVMVELTSTLRGAKIVIFP